MTERFEITKEDAEKVRFLFSILHRYNYSEDGQKTINALMDYFDKIDAVNNFNKEYEYWKESSDI